MANRTVTNLTAVLQMNNTKFKKGLSTSQKALKTFQSQIKQVGVTMAGAFAVGSLVNFGKEAVKIAMKAEGIRAAFIGLDRPDLLDDLKRATRETVSELDLMQAAVKAKNFKIPLEQLATFFQFATDRAIQTGESVEYLTQSIVDGIGRKSSLVLDNLGISATELQEEIKKTGDFGKAAANIIAREMKKAGTVLDTTATQAARLNARFQDMKEGLGRDLITGIVGLADAIEGNLNPAIGVGNRLIKQFNKELEELAKRDNAAQGNLIRSMAVGPNQNMIGLMKAEGLKITAGAKKEADALALASKLAAEEYAKLMATVQTPISNQDFALSLPSGFEQFFGGGVGVDLAINQMVKLSDGVLDINQGLADTDGYLDDMEEGIDEAFSGESFSKVDKMSMGVNKLGKSVGVMLVSSFDSLGEAIGRSMSGAEDSLKSLGQAILQNLGNILIMAGFQSGNIGLIVAGAAIQLGSGIMRGLGDGVNSQSMGNAYGGGSNVNFTISGKNLVGVLGRNSTYHNQVT